MRLIFALVFVLLAAVVHTLPLSEEMINGEMDEGNYLFNDLVEEISENDDDDMDEDDDDDDENDVTTRDIYTIYRRSTIYLTVEMTSA